MTAELAAEQDVVGSRPALAQSDERAQLRGVFVDLGEAEVFIEGPLTRVSIGQKDMLADPSVGVEQHLRQPAPNSGSLHLGIDQDVLQVRDRLAVGKGSSEPDEPTILACRDDTVRGRHGP